LALAADAARIQELREYLNRCELKSSSVPNSLRGKAFAKLLFGQRRILSMRVLNSAAKKLS
jgi:hypothetical protein